MHLGSRLFKIQTFLLSFIILYSLCAGSSFLYADTSKELISAIETSNIKKVSQLLGQETLSVKAQTSLSLFAQNVIQSRVNTLHDFISQGLFFIKLYGIAHLILALPFFLWVPWIEVPGEKMTHEERKAMALGMGPVGVLLCCLGIKLWSNVFQRRAEEKKLYEDAIKIKLLIDQQGAI